MAWRVCKVIDFRTSCSVLHSREAAAQEDTAQHLSDLITKLSVDLPNFRGVWEYDRNFPGFVEDVEDVIGNVSERLGAGDAWGGYDAWHRFMNAWEERLPIPIWVMVGTVIVEGPGPTVEPAYSFPDLRKSKKGLRPIEDPRKARRREQAEYLSEALGMLMQVVGRNIMTDLEDAGRPVALAELRQTIAAEVVKLVETYQDEVMNVFGPEEFYSLVDENVRKHYGI